MIGEMPQPSLIDRLEHSNDPLAREAAAELRRWDARWRDLRWCSGGCKEASATDNQGGPMFGGLL